MNDQGHPGQTRAETKTQTTSPEVGGIASPGEGPRTARAPFTLADVANLFVIGSVVLGPILMLFVSSFDVGPPGTEGIVFGLEHWDRAYETDATWDAAWNTIALGATRTGIALFVAGAIAWLIARTDMPGGKAFEFLIWVGFFIPTLPLTIGWILLLHPSYGVVNEVLRGLLNLGGDTGPLNIHSFLGIVWVHITSSTVPFMVILLVPPLRRMGAVLEESARMSGASRLRTVRYITAPLMTPAILAAVILSFVWSLKAFEIELLLGTPIGLDVYSTQIYDWIQSSPPEFGIATALGAVFIVVMFGMAYLYRRLVSGREYTTITGRTDAQPIPLTRFGRYAALAFVGTFVLLAIGVPTVLVILGSFMRFFGFFDIAEPFSAMHWQAMLQDRVFTSSLRNTLVLATSSTVIGVIVYFAIANIVTRTRLRSRGAVDFLAWSPVAIPGMLLGLGLLWVYLQSGPGRVLYGSIAGLVVAVVIAEMATGTQQMKAGLLQIDPQLEWAARTSGAGRVRTYYSILAPLVAPTIANVAILVFAFSVREISTFVLISSGNSRPLSILMLEYSFGGELERGAALGVVITVLMAAFAVVARRFSDRSVEPKARSVV